MFLWDSITPFGFPVVPEVNSNMLISSLSISASKNSLSPSFNPLIPRFITSPKPIISSSLPSFVIFMRVFRQLSSFPLIFLKISSYLSSYIMAETSAFLTMSSIFFSGSSLSMGTTTPTPQTTAKYEIAHLDELLPMIAIFLPFNPNFKSPVPNSLYISNRSLNSIFSYPLVFRNFS